MNRVLDRLLLYAAVSGAFDPDDLLNSIPDNDRDALAGALSQVCDEVIAERVRWRLAAAARRERLARMVGTDEARMAIAGAPAATDRFAETLRAALLGTYRPSVQGRVRSRTDAEALRAATEADGEIHSALQFAAHAPFVDEARRREWLVGTADRIAEREGRIAASAALPDRLIGRTRELRRLQEFATAVTLADRRPITVTGLGGVGKSALIAALVQALDGSPVLVVVVDFDRADLAKGDPLPVVAEFLRQLEPAWRLRGQGEAATLAQTLRRQIRQSMTERARLRQSIEQQRAFLATFVFRGLQAIPDELRSAPLLMVLDSFETQSAAEARETLDLEAELAEVLPGLRTIVATRELPFADADDSDPVSGETRPGADRFFGPKARRIELEGLSPSDGARFLASRDTGGRFPDRQARTRAAAALKGHPLALIVLERFARNATDAEIDRLLQDVEADPGFSAAFAHAFLYDRVLDRIRDPAVRALAHPGLVLREVTPDLIRLVLSGPCEMAPMPGEQAEALFEALRKQFWLVEPATEGALRHRPDLRRMMLPGMFAGPKEGDIAREATRKAWLAGKCQEVARAAQDFWQNGPPLGDPACPFHAARPPERREIEATYYGALAGDSAPAALRPERARALADGIGADLETLNVYWRAEIKAGIGADLSAAEREALSIESRAAAERARTERALRRGDAAEARRLSEAEEARRRNQEALARVQSRMKDLRIYAGRIDGVVGPKTRAAIEDLARQVGAAVDEKWLGSPAGKLADQLGQLVERLEAQLGELVPRQEAGPPASVAAGPMPDAAMSEASVLQASARAEGSAPDLDLVDRRLRAAMTAGFALTDEAEADARYLLEAVARAEMPPVVAGEAAAWRLWNTSLWQGTLALAASGAAPALAEGLAHPLPELAPSVSVARALLSRLVPAGRKGRRPASHIDVLLPRLDWRLAGIDGARAASLMVLEGSARSGGRDIEVALDAGALHLIGRNSVLALSNRVEVEAGDGRVPEAALALLRHATANKEAPPQRSGPSATVGEAQFRMRLLGLGAGVVDGIMGPRTMAGLRQFIEEWAPFRLQDESLIEPLRQIEAGAAELATFEQLWTSGAKVILRLGKAQAFRGAVLAALRGGTPELHEPAARALGSVLQGDFESIVSTVIQSAPSWPADFRLDMQKHISGRLALPVVQTADRCGVLGLLLALLARRSPAARPLLRMHDALNAALGVADSNDQPKGGSA